MSKSDTPGDSLKPTVEQVRSRLSPDDPRLLVEARCQELGIPYEWRVFDINSVSLRIGLANGRQKRWRYISSQQARSWASFNLRDLKALGDLDAYYFADEGTIEASVYPLGRLGRTSPALLELPGVKVQKKLSPQVELELDAEPDQPIFNKRGYSEGRTRPEAEAEWTLSFTGSSNVPYGLSIGSASPRFAIVGDSLGGQRATLKIDGLPTSRHDEACDILSRVAGAIFFELDLKYGISLNIRRARLTAHLHGRRRRAIPSNETPCTPENQYLERPLSLYWYARSAYGMPLLEFLAFYQVLEYHFPTYSHREALERVRNELRDPRFKREDDRHVAKLITLASQFSQGYGKEREQLKATIRACVTVDQLREFFNEDPKRLDHFESKYISDVTLINLDEKNKVDLRDQVADRIYDLRCRIVHSKDDAGARYSEMLLPFSEEADYLGPDIDLVHLLAQKVLIASSSTLRP
ncbi:hypothetical protein ACWENQ_08645 [Nonomuraea sp. NPDC004354]